MPEPVVKPKPTAERLQHTWELLTGLPSDEETDAEVARIETLGASARARELEEAGFSPSEVAARARHLRERIADRGEASESLGAEREPLRGEEGEARRPVLQAVQAVPAVAPEAPGETSRRVTRFAALCFLVAAAFVIIAVEITAHRSKEPLIAQPSPSSLAPPPSPEKAATANPASELRERAELACRASAWGECRDLLDRAAGIDPGGDRDPEVARLRRRIAEALAPQRGGKAQ